MTREELLELAALDALGLLDEYEAALYTRSFHHAPATVQDEIRDLQAAVAADGSLLPETEPRSELRSIVLDAVSAAIERDSEDFSPLALIGRARHERESRSRAAAVSSAGQFWRAASFILIGALVVAFYFAFHFRMENALLRDFALQAHTQAGITGQFVRDVHEKYIHNPNSMRIVLSSAKGEPGRVGIVYIDERTGEAFVMCQHVPQRGEIRITARDVRGQSVVNRFVQTHGSIVGVEIGKVSVDIAASLTWTVVDAETGATLLTSA